jgi:hypothetical protein
MLRSSCYKNIATLPNVYRNTDAGNGDGKENEMPGIMVFKTLADALRAGYHVYDRTDHGYLVRTRTSAGWAMAIVTCR